MFKNKISILMFICIVIFFFSSLIAYILLKKNIEKNHINEERIIFYKSKVLSTNLINKLIYDYSLQKNILKQKHIEVKKYLNKQNNLDEISLKKIHEEINKGLKDKPYDIYLTDENLFIQKSTFKSDIGFDLSFAKDIFEKHKKEEIVGISAPNFENTSKNFYSYADSYLKNTNRLLQVSYKYQNTQKILNEIKELILNNKNLYKSSAYVIFENGYIENIIFDDKQKASNKKLKEDYSTGILLNEKLKNKTLFIENINKNNNSYKKLYFLQDSQVFPKNKIIFVLVFDENIFFDKLIKLKYITLFLVLLGLFSIYFIFKIREKEILLSQKNDFIRHSIHEIKTPLSIISLNNQLRDRIVGKDKYSVKISSAIKSLQNSYDDMSFFIVKNKLNYKIQNLNLKNILEERVDFFYELAISQSRRIQVNIYNDLFLNINKIELIRFLDNNISNAIKYSEINSVIEIILENNKLLFSSEGKEINDKKNIFKKYYRENNILGGHGIGLNIVYDICQKYKILVKVDYKYNNNVFEYKFCHFSDTLEI